MIQSQLQTARARIADCLQRDEQGGLVQRRDHLNLAGLGLTREELEGRFDPHERDLPEVGLADLRYLRYLDLTGNQLAALPDCVASFTDLVWLGLNFNRIERLSEEIGALTALERLYLRGNPLAELPAAIGSLRALQELDLTGCGIATLPFSMAALEALEYVAFEENALAPDLRAAWKEGGWSSLREHLARAAQAVRPEQFVGKVVLVGSQAHGKTCLQRALRGLAFEDPLPSTDGMNRERLHLDLDGRHILPEQRAARPGPRPDVIDLTLWDMGGQQSYQHTHQMFFTESAVYLVVTLQREGGDAQDLDRWIELVKRRTTGQATVIVVSTWCQKYRPGRALTLEGLRARHGEMIRALALVDSQDGTGIQELRELLATVVQEPRTKCRHTWLPGWAKVLNDLASASQPFLRWGEVREICLNCGITGEGEQRQVVRTGHYIGSVLWREDIPAGEDVVILNPDWLCRAVVRLLDDEVTRQSHGLVDEATLDRVWLGPGGDGTPGYDRRMFPALIELMEINELAYRPREPGHRVGEGPRLLVTQMVENTPPLDLEARWQAISPQDAAESVRVVAFRKVDGPDHEAVPDLIYLLIFRLREFSLGRADYREARHWQRGLLVTDDYGSAGRIELEGPRLRITVRHRLGDGLMHSIIHRIGVRDDGYWNGRGLEKVEFVPCGRACPVRTPERGLIAMDSCVKASRVGNTHVECQACRELVSISDLLSDTRAEPPPALELRTWLEPLLLELQRGQSGLLDAVAREGEATRARLADLQSFVRMQGDGILDAFTGEWKEGPRLFSLLPIKGRRWNPRTWATMRFRVTVWCEASRQPVPFYREPKNGSGESTEFRGTETITLTREWVQRTGKLLKWSSWAMLAATTGGPALVGGLVTAAGGVITSEQAAALNDNLASQQAALKDVAAIIDGERRLPLADETRRGGNLAAACAGADRSEFGTPEEEDLRIIRFLREAFKKKDPTWGGLEPRDDGRFGRIWAHPKAPVGEAGAS